MSVLRWLMVLSLVGALPRSGGAEPPSPAPVPSASPSGGTVAEARDFGPEARLLARLAACADGKEPIPPALEPVVKAHCDWLRPKMDEYLVKYVAGAQPFLLALQPPSLPPTVIYPFGGGDLITALTTYPQATEIDTLSLEHAGDPRRITAVDAVRLERGLDRLRRSISQLLTLSDSASDDMMRLERGDIPGQLTFFLVGLTVHGQEVVSLRYFDVRPDGTLAYLSEADIKAREAQAARRLHGGWNAPDFSEAFSNLEMTFRPRGAAAGAPVRVHRHLAANLDDVHLGADPRVLRYLDARGRVTAMTKAASYLLWSRAFEQLRAWLLGHMEFMLSDSTGIPPRFAQKAGFLQETYGSFSGPFLKEANEADAEAFRALWKSQPARPLAFRYGYGDAARAPHLLVTRRPPPSPAPAPAHPPAASAAGH